VNNRHRFHQFLAARAVVLAYAALGCGLFCASWFLLVDVEPTYRPHPEEVTCSLLHVAVSKDGSAQRVFAGFAVAAILPVPLGLAMGISAKLRLMTFPVLELLRRGEPAFQRMKARSRSMVG
jgi:ABC-type nitrate/sulfonate/bicarbonate transport system permease component